MPSLVNLSQPDDIMTLKRWKTLTLVLLAWTSMSQAAGTVAIRSSSAGVEVSLRIVETCSIQTHGGAGASVECQHGSLYAIQPPANDASGAPVLTVAF